LIIDLWEKVERFVRREAKNEPECAVIETRSGKPIRYWDVEFSEKKDEMSGATVKGGPRKKLYGGLLVENLVQCTARCVFGEMLIKAEAAGLPVCLHVHDSITVEVAESEGQAALDLLVSIMSEAPAWAEGLPVAAEGEIRRHY
jgi:DNA polymerase